MTIVMTRHTVLILAKISPAIGLVVIVASLELDGEAGFWPGVWRISMSIALGVFVTLVGAIYQNLNRRLEAIELSAKNDFVPRKEYDSRQQDMIRQLERIENLLTRKA